MRKLMAVLGMLAGCGTATPPRGSTSRSGSTGGTSGGSSSSGGTCGVSCQICQMDCQTQYGFDCPGGINEMCHRVCGSTPDDGGCVGQCNDRYNPMDGGGCDGQLATCNAGC